MFAEAKTIVVSYRASSLAMFDKQVGLEVSLLLGSVRTLRTQELWLLPTFVPLVLDEIPFVAVCLRTPSAAKGACDKFYIHF